MWIMAAAQAPWRLFGLFTGIDLAIIAVLLLSIGLGFYSGFIWQILRIVSVVVSLWVAWVYHPYVAESLGSSLSEPTRRIAGAILVFCGMLLVCYLVSYLFRDILNALKPQMPDRILGAVFGCCKGALLVGVVAFLVLRYAGNDSGLRRHVEESKAATAMAVCAETFLHLLPDKARQGVEGTERVEQTEAAGREAAQAAMAPSGASA